MSLKYQILYIVNDLSPTSIPIEWASILHKRGWNVAVLAVERQPNQVEPEQLEVPVIKMNNYRRGNPRVIWEIRQKIRQYDVRLIHTHQNYSGSMASLAVLANRNVYVTKTEHALHDGFKKTGLLLNSITMLRSDYHCFNSNSTSRSLKWWEKLLVRNTPQRVIYNGVNTNKIEAQRKFKDETYAKWKLSPERFYVAKIANFKEVKDHTTVLKAFQLLTRKHPQTRLLLIGNKTRCKKLKEQVKKLGISDRVYLMGLLNRNEVYRLLHILNVSVMTSKYEGFCNTIVESMAAKLPVVLTDIPTFREVVGETGIYFRVGEFEDLADKLEQLITNENIHRKYAKLAYDRCFRRFDIAKAIDGYEEVYRFLLRD